MEKDHAAAAFVNHGPDRRIARQEAPIATCYTTHSL